MSWKLYLGTAKVYLAVGMWFSSKRWLGDHQKCSWQRWPGRVGRGSMQWPPLPHRGPNQACTFHGSSRRRLLHRTAPWNWTQNWQAGEQVPPPEQYLHRERREDMQYNRENKQPAGQKFIPWCLSLPGLNQLLHGSSSTWKCRCAMCKCT